MLATTLRVHIRWTIRRDLPEVLAIQAQTPDPWNEDAILAALRQQNTIGLSAEDTSSLRILGHVIYTLEKRRILVRRLTVDPSAQRKGVGTALLTRLVDKLAPHRRNRLVIPVPDWNLGAQLWLRSLDVPCVRIDEDQYIFALRV